MFLCSQPVVRFYNELAESSLLLFVSLLVKCDILTKCSVDTLSWIVERISVFSTYIINTCRTLLLRHLYEYFFTLLGYKPYRTTFSTFFRQREVIWGHRNVWIPSQTFPNLTDHCRYRTGNCSFRSLKCYRWAVCDYRFPYLGNIYLLCKLISVLMTWEGYFVFNSAILLNV